MQKKSFVVIATIVSVTVFMFQNCSEVDFAPENSELEAIASSAEAIVINNGDAFTNQNQVQLGLNASFAEEMYVTNDPECKSGGQWEPYKTSKTWQLSQSNEQAKVFVKYKDFREKESPCVSDSIVHDDIAPVVTVTASPQGLETNLGSAQLSFSILEEGSGVKSTLCNLDANRQPCENPATLTVAEGLHKVTVEVTDRAGNRGTSSSQNWLVDQTAPTVELINTPANPSSDRTAAFEFQAQDEASGVARLECKLDGNTNYESCETLNSQTYTNLKDGSHTFYVRAIDDAGNASDPASYTWTIDSQVPWVEITDAPDAYTRETAASISFQGGDGNGKISYQCQLDGASAVDCSSPYLESGPLVEGPHQFQVIAIDAAGNQSSPAVANWIVDHTPPVPDIAKAPSEFSNLSSPSFENTATDNYSAPENILFECRVDQNDFASCTASQTIPDLTDGFHQYDLRVIDQAGNRSEVISYTWTIDTVAPVVSWLQTPPAVMTTIETYAIEFDVADAAPTSGLASITCTGLEGTCQSQTPLTLTEMSIAQYTYTVTAEDKAGNIGSATYKFEVVAGTRDTNTAVQITEKSNTSDILFVVDTTGSMQHEQRNLADYWSNIVGPLQGLNWRIGMTTTDVASAGPGEDGRLVDFTAGQDLYFLSPDVVDVDTLFKQTMADLDKGDESDSAVSALYRLTERTALSGSPEQTFVRPEANLDVVIVSDGDEDGTDPVRSNPDNLKQIVAEQLGAEKDFTVYGILHLEESTCPSNGSQVSHTYRQLVTDTGGVYKNICDADWSLLLRDIGQNIFDRIRTVTLECAPYEGQVQVFDATTGTEITQDQMGRLVDGDQVIFDEILPIGSYDFRYQCEVFL